MAEEEGFVRSAKRDGIAERHAVGACIPERNAGAAKLTKKKKRSNSASLFCFGSEQAP